VSDVEALDWLDRLLAADEPSRAASLDELAGRDPQLHARLKRLLAGALAPEDSRVLAAPVLDGVAQLADATRSLQPGDVLAGYRLLRELGRGGMSVVWLAERADGVVKRSVALKMPMFMLQGAGDLERFGRERDALAALSHPNVARLYDAGVLPSGQPFIVLEHVDGTPCTAHCDSRRLDIRARLRLFLQVLAAVEHAHKHLVVHRDLKPSNILVDAEGQVKLLDFGIAKRLGETEAASPLTQVMGVAMTPLYAAPEQLRGATISTLTDVYSLGLVLFELLTGRLPYRGSAARATLVEVLEALGRGTMPRASQAAIDEAAALVRARPSAARLRGELQGDLDTIIGKALRIAPEDRYGSAAHLADDIRRYLDHKPIAARRPSFWYSTRLALARHRLAAGVAAVGVTLISGASVVAWLQYRESRAHAERTAAVRDFMFNLVDEAEAAEGQVGEVTGRQMVDGAVARARSDFDTQPLLQGELLGELGRMYLRLGAADSAVKVLEESVATLERRARPDDAALNKARAFLAQALMQTGGDAARIQSLAQRARAACTSQDADCAKARAYAGSILSQLASNAGDKERALAEMRSSAADTEFAFGTHNPETVMTWMSVAIIARNGGHLVEAGQAMERAVRAAEGLRLRAADRIELERSMALIDLDLGHYAAARDRLLALAAQELSARERGLQLRILANAYVELGDASHALRTSAEAVAAVPQDEKSAALAFARQVQARALLLAGQNSEALAELDQVIRGLLAAGRSPDSTEVLRARRQRAQALLAAGRTAEALESLRELDARFVAAQGSPVERGLTLDLLGVAESRAGDAGAARAAHEAARTELLRQLPEQHPYLVQNAALRGGA
jgi:serine/threonine-protein kinase